MELRVLAYFVATAEAGTVSGAAVALHMTQPALSRQLRGLERELGVDLFTRARGRLTLNAAGTQFLPVARDLLRRADEARDAASALAAGRLEALTIATRTTTLTDVIAPFVAGLRPDDPVPTILETEVGDPHLALRDGADLALVFDRPGPDLAGAPIAVLPVWAYVRADHAWAGRRSVALDALVAERLVVLRAGMRARHVLDVAVETAGLALGSHVESSHPQVAQALAAAGRGVAVVTDDPRFDLVPLEIEGAHGPVRVHLWAAWEPDHHAAGTLADLTSRLRAFCVARYGEGVAPPTD
ncbi:LysR family transcriptional regulator [Mumia zhuanghuii]|uniref:LysR family transcriptional regulator n=1 Tax=Mumia zhuanghuii TaxID=2585211 RepID=A0A5C4MF52_9ACTN|nr:LysR family transcriptional regulator [Mumia zhuanghuii]TNC34614.1 LysR family transcriptional regulator [Mumia zhuanghuii]TNC43672.1 LysR family transcriptional regulator [Mumia zhuanghuii]